jgi:hypothetical protein
MIRFDLCHHVADLDATRLDNFGIDPAQIQGSADFRVDKQHRVQPKAFDKFLTPSVRLGRDFNNSLALFQPSSRRQVLAAQIQVNIQLIPGQRPTITGLSDPFDGSGIHDIQLHVGVRAAIIRERTALGFPIVADQAIGQIQFAHVQYLA